ncbi:uncharacterized protein LOC117303389 [Asterias rubens]|uniref:uncharacterized protein LOC117303389 n=1 Tax=Asterias rubens TaxID=7604 RepID=UPI001455B161|nr:uncharacterized protein LOC117303389 [Asterias rubens]
MADEDVQVIYKGWLRKSITAETKKKSFLNRQSSTLKKRYFVLLRQADEEDGEECAFLYTYDKEPATESEAPKAKLKLSPHYRVDKKHDATGKCFTFEVRTPDESYRLQSETETNMDLWVFYLQIQTKLMQEFPGYCFEVTPDESDPMRRIGAKGSKCLLHISKWGLTLALKRTRSLLAQWPLKSIRIFESSETGAFSVDAGRSAPMGEARYLFGTKPCEDGQMYDLLDAFTTEMQAQRNVGSMDPDQPATDEEVVQEYERLRLATFGLLNRRTASVLSSGTPSASAAVPVPHSRGATEGYDRLHRAQEVAHQQMERPPAPGPRSHGIQIRNNHPQALPRGAGPPLPPRQEGIRKSPSSSFQRSYSERRDGQSLERHEYPFPESLKTPPSSFQRSYSERARSLEGSAESAGYPAQDCGPYAVMKASETPPSGVRVHRASEGDILQGVRGAEFPRNVVATDKFKRMVSNPGTGMTEYEMMAIRLGQNPYQNSGVSLLPNSYENTPLISPSPQNMPTGFGNLGFVTSPQSVESGGRLPQQRYQTPNSVAVDVHADQTDKHQPIRHSYFQHQFRDSNSGATAPRGPEVGAQRRPLSDLPGYAVMKDGTLGSHQYQEVRLWQRPTTLRRSMSVGHLFRSPSVSSSISSVFSVGSPMLGSLDLAVSLRRGTRAPTWMANRELPSPPPPGTFTPEFNTYCGSPRAVHPPFADFSTLNDNPTPYEDFKGNRSSFNNNNQRRSVLSASEVQGQLSEVASERSAREKQENEDGYLEPVIKIKRSRSEGDILDAIQTDDDQSASPRGKKAHSRSRKARGIFATLRKRTKSNTEGAVTSGGGTAVAEPEQEPSRSTNTSVMKRSQSIPDILDEGPPLFPQPYKRSPNVSGVKPASHSSVGTSQKWRKFDLPKIFRSSGKTEAREDVEGEGKNDGKTERRTSKSSLTDVQSPPKAQVGPVPFIKGNIVASEKAKSFVKVRSKASPIIASNPRMVPSSPVDMGVPRMHSPNPGATPVLSQVGLANKERLREVINRPLPSPPTGNGSKKTQVKQFSPVTKQGSPDVSRPAIPQVKRNSKKKTPPPPPPRNLVQSSLPAPPQNMVQSSPLAPPYNVVQSSPPVPPRSLVQSSPDCASLKSSRTNSNASDYENTVTVDRRLSGSSQLAKSSSFSDRSLGRSSLDNVSLRSSRTNSNGSQYENTSFGSLPAEEDISHSQTRRLSSRNSGVSLNNTEQDVADTFL